MQTILGNLRSLSGCCLVCVRLAADESRIGNEWIHNPDEWIKGHG